VASASLATSRPTVRWSESQRRLRNGTKKAPGAGCLAAVSAPNPVAISHARKTPGRPHSVSIRCARANAHCSPAHAHVKRPSDAA
jgi:hypothetical protein